MNPDIAAAHSTTEADKNRRRFKNFLLKPNYQIRYGYYVAAGSFALFGITASLIWRKLAEIDALLNQGPGTAVSFLQLTDLHADVTRIALSGFFFYCLFTCIHALVMCHRVAGPMTAIVECIEQLRKGNYGYKRELRRNDELKPIHRALQRLAARLYEDEA